ncbi:MAG TPA: amino acid ABC transporter permease [Candidatus Competibacteraceae bacterium]|nr:MAG: amino acid ABC transporter permease [Candidatus Competibacteraceae bacterium]HOB63042.1 amino acid ABC transporter permease [Candidatus Competibacteraceae bacterium]HQA26647.1 amino acid ABC transporter permease [Candidatus Competibacteraceae bacterium]HQD57488.1 amino acid ABC transporter permease [Candidatus Competibacteraceae bacterium]
MPPRKLRFGWLDALILALLGGALGYVLHQAQDHFHYNWDWRLIPGYFLRYDPAQGQWVLNLLGQGLLATIRLALWGSLLAALIGGVMGVCRVAHSLFLRLLSRSYVELIRNMPPLVFIFIFYFFISSQLMPALDVEGWLVDAGPTTLSVLALLFGPPELLSNFLSGLICLALFEGAYVTEIVRAGIEAVPKGQWEGGRALGLNSRQVLREIVLPQAVQRVIPPLAGQFISLIKDSSLISLISIQELTFTGTELAVSSGQVFEVWLTVAALYFLLCFILARLFRRLELRLARHRQR